MEDGELLGDDADDSREEDSEDGNGNPELLDRLLAFSDELDGTTLMMESIGPGGCMQYHVLGMADDGPAEDGASDDGVIEDDT